MNLDFLGWSTYFQQSFDALGRDSLQPARVIRQNKHKYIVHNGRQTLSATLLGRILYESDDPAMLPAVSSQSTRPSGLAINPSALLAIKTEHFIVSSFRLIFL